MGLEFLRAENYRRALHFFNEAIRRASKTFGTRHPILSEAYQGIGQLYVQQKKYSQALAYFQRAIIALALNFDSRNIYSNPQLTNISDEVRLTNALFAKARALHDLFAMNTHNLCDLKSSVNTYELTIDLINKISNSYLSETTKFFFSDTVHSIFKQAVAAAAELYFVSQNETYKELAFVFVEKSKAALLRQVLLDKRAKQFAHIPDSLLQQENQFKIEIAFCRNQLFETLRKDKQAENVLAISWRNKLFSAERNYETLISQLKANYPNYYHLKFESDIPSVAELQRRLQTDGSTLIDYFYDEHVLYIFTVAKQNFELRKVMLDSPLDDNISGLRKCLIDRDSQKYFFFAKELYNKLIAPIKENIKDKKIIILPDGKLGYLPFETLISHYSDTTNYRAALYLLQDLQIRYAYSVTQLFENNTCEPSRKKLDFVGFAPVNFH